MDLCTTAYSFDRSCTSTPKVVARYDLEASAMRRSIQIVIRVNIASILLGIAAIITALR